MMLSPDDFSLGAALFIFWGLSVYFAWEIRGNIEFRREQELLRRQLRSQCDTGLADSPCVTQ
jgi:hypothetical protein